MREKSVWQLLGNVFTDSGTTDGVEGGIYGKKDSLAAEAVAAAA
jgi:hypothetical protein